MYLDSDYQNYKYLVSCSDNFVVLSTKHHLSGSSGDPDTIPIIYNYLTDGSVFESSYTSEDSLTFSDISSSFTDDLSVLTLAPLYTIYCCFIIMFILFLINNLTKLIKKGGVFGSN